MSGKTITLLAAAIIIAAGTCFAASFVSSISSSVTPKADEHGEIHIVSAWTTNPPIVITDEKDRRIIYRILGSSRMADFDSPSCPFGAIAIRLTAQGKPVEFYPATDDCAILRYGKSFTYIYISDAEMRELRELWVRHGLPPHGA